VKRTVVGKGIVGKFLFDAADLSEHGAGVFSEAQGCGRGNEALAGTDEEFGVKVGREIVQLEADSARREEHFFGGARDAGEFHDGEEELELAEFHNVSVT
jgi:hypothetical protein